MALAKFSDLPVANRIFSLASKRKTDPGAEAAQRPLMTLSDGPRIANPALSDKARRGREAFYAGDSKRALTLATADVAHADVPSWCGPNKASLALLDGYGGNSWRLVTTASGGAEAALCPSISD